MKKTMGGIGLGWGEKKNQEFNPTQNSQHLLGTQVGMSRGN